MSLTTDQLKSLSFGYLSGEDLLQWCATQLLIKQYEVDNNSLQKGCDQAISEIIASFSTKYNLTTELQKKGNITPAAIAIVTAGAVSAINVLVPGNNLTTAPLVSLIGGGGAGATATVSISNNALDTFIIVSGGTNYTTAPTVFLSGGQSTDTRSILLVKILSLLSIRNVLGNMQNISDKMTADFKWTDKQVMDIRNGQMNIPVELVVNQFVSSGAFLVSDSFKTLG